MSILGELVKRRRLELGWTQRQLADEAGVSNPLVCLIEGGKRGFSPRFETVVRLARALELSPLEVCDAAGLAVPVESAVDVDPFLSEPQRKRLLAFYAELVLEAV